MCKASPTGEIVVITCSAHWADINNQLLKHWDHHHIFLISPDSLRTFTTERRVR